DDDLDQLLRAHYHAAVDGVTVPDRLLRRVLEEAEPKRGGAANSPILAFALAGASFLIILVSSRVVEVLLSL
ncbi:MAG: hypothetical protein ACYDH4_13250, partial [Candidatus Cryosericum sp.]